MIVEIEELLKYEAAGDPMTGTKWMRTTPQKIAEILNWRGFTISRKTVAAMLLDMDFSLKANRKAIATNDHAFRSDAAAIAVPYGLYDVLANAGTVVVGTSSDTPEFAVHSIATWWRHRGRHQYRGKRQLLILADGGGSNGSRPRAWRHELQANLADRYGLTVTGAHYPTGSSKWNPIEHRLFSEISKNWAGRPLDSLQTMLNYIQTTTTAGGLNIRAYLDTREYAKGVRISDADMNALALKKRSELERWNYAISPRLIA